MKKSKVCGYSSAIVIILAIVSGVVLYNISDAEDIWLVIFGITLLLGMPLAIALFFLAAYISTRPEKKKEKPKIVKIET